MKSAARFIKNTIRFQSLSISTCPFYTFEYKVEFKNVSESRSFKHDKP